MSSFEPLTNTTPTAPEGAGAPPTSGNQRTAERIGLWCLVSLAALFVVAELSAPGALVLVAAITFAFAALAWIVLVYRQWSTGGLTLPRTSAIWAATLAGVGLTVGGFVLGRIPPFGRLGSVLLLGGLLISYIGIGLAIVRMRSQLWAPDPVRTGWRWWVWVRATLRRASRSPLVLGLVLLGLLVLAALGALLLGGAPSLLAGGLIGVGIAPVPAVLGLLAEHALHAERLSWAQEGRGRAAVMVVAALATFGVIAVATSGAEFPWLWTAVLLVLAALVVAVVSGTLADIAAVLLALALMGVASPTTPALADPWPSDKHVIVALGDSYLSGEGARQFIEGTDDGGVNECRRARTAWPVLVTDRKPFDGLVFLACSGAQTYNLRTAAKDALEPTPRAQYPDSESTQLQTYRSRFAPLVTQPPLVVLSLGGNDLGFATVGLTCLAPGSCNDPIPNGLFSKGNLKRVANRLRQAYAEVRDTFPRSPVVVIPYPDPIDAADAPCAQAPLEKGDVTFIAHLLDALDNQIADVAADYGFYVADPMRDVLARQHLQLCDPENHGRAGINFVNAQSVGGVSGNRFNPVSWKHGSLHPNERGHAALARAFESWLQGLGNGDVAAGLDALEPATARTGTPSVAPVAEKYSTGTKDDCAVVDGPTACNDQATAWALDQLGTSLLRAGLAVLLVVLGAWCFGVALVKRP